MKQISAFAIISVLILCSLRAQKPSPEYPTVEIPGWYAEAIAVGLREFRQSQGGKTERGEPVYGDLRNYSVHINSSPSDELPLKYAREECVRIYFVPALSKKDREEVITGGRTSFGIEVAYDVHRRTMKIVKTSFAR